MFLVRRSVKIFQPVINRDAFEYMLTTEYCRRAGIVAVSARQLKPIEKLKLKLTTKSQIEFGQPRY